MRGETRNAYRDLVRKSEETGLSEGLDEGETIILKEIKKLIQSSERYWINLEQNWEQKNALGDVVKRPSGFIKCYEILDHDQ